MKSISLIILSGILGLVVSCQSRTNLNAGIQLEEITSRLDTSSGFIDVFLRIVSDDETDSSHVYVAKGLYKGKTVGLKFEVVQGITSERTIFSQQDFAYHSVKIYSIGQESDQFVKSLGDLYGLPTTKPFTKLPILSNVFSLNQKVADLNKTDYYLV